MPGKVDGLESPFSGDEVIYRGLKYQRKSTSFLNHEQALYALRQIWGIATADMSWNEKPIIVIHAIEAVQAEVEIRNPTAGVMKSSLHCFVNGHFPNSAEKERGLPVCFRVLPDHVSDETTGELRLGFDLVALAFVLLSRWEESSHRLSLDEHGRPIESELFPVKAGMHDRPVLDLWSLALRKYLTSRGVAVKGRKPNLLITCDVDRPLRFLSVGRVLRGAAGELICRSKNLHAAFKELRTGLSVLLGIEPDPYLQRIVELATWSEQLGTYAHFYVMTSVASRFDEGVQPSRREIQQVLSSLVARGHTVGWHPGYNAALADDIFTSELERFSRLPFPVTKGGRHHYLRWQAEAWDKWNAAGMQFDSSLGFSSCIGFRCGTSHPFPVFSNKINRVLPLIERPLLVMDVACAKLQTRGIEFEAHLDLALNDVCEVGGEFVMLIHNCFRNMNVLEIMNATAARASTMFATA